MPFIEKIRALFGSSARRRRRRTGELSQAVQYLEVSRAVGVLLFIVTTAAIVTISFVGVQPAGLQILPNQQASVRISAAVPFSYESDLLSRRQREQMRTQVPPVFRIDLSNFQQYETHLRELLADLQRYEDTWTAMPPAERAIATAAAAEAFNAKGAYRLIASDLATLIEYGDAAARQELFERGLFILREIQRPGIYDNTSSLSRSAANSMVLFHIMRESGEVSQTRVQSTEDALMFLRINLSAENIPPETATAMFRLLRNGISQNLMFDREQSERLQREMLEALRPVIVHVESGRSIIEPGTRVTLEQHEMLLAYQAFLNRSESLATPIDLQLLGRVILVLAVVMAAVFYIRMEDRLTLRSNGRLALLALVVVLNLSLVRLAFELSNSPLIFDNPDARALLPYIAPTALAPIIAAVLLGLGPSIFIALVISIFTGVIYGNRLDLLVVTFLASTIAIYSCREIRARGRLVRAGGLAGSIIALFALLLGFTDQLPMSAIVQQMVAALTTGLVTGIAVVGLLPILESLFRRTTDITLLELSDFNHPLLRRMQFEAPGTYHHSLMVGNLSENAASLIGANALLCRVCSMFHDIGKMIKPDYFTENQRGPNPHDEKSPSFSALVIKSHVKEGVDLAAKHKLPRPVVDVIRQHHGTSLIKYFYQRAVDTERSASRSPMLPGMPIDPPERVSESTYRYDGPKPQFRESAIIFLADSVEAASRSLKKVTPQNVEELVESIFRDRVEDGQLDECPITFADLAKIRRSFVFTLLNSLHTRVEYPKTEKDNAKIVREAEQAATRSG
jgi:cyclic-di-AMP phosphodiesterase PgpH